MEFYNLIYIDPGTGSIILQTVLGAILGIGVALKLFWHRILVFLGVRKKKQKDTEDLSS